MKIIALDSSGLTASVAIVDNDCLIAEYSVNYKKTHSQTLLPMLDEISRMTELSLDTVDAIAIAKGPGSFTGLRIGSATAKGLGLALDIPIIEVPTTDALAYNFYGTDKVVCPMMDARREQIYTGLYDFVNDGGYYRLHVIQESCAVPVETMIQKVNQIGREVIFLGDGVQVYGEQIKGMTTVPYIMAPAHRNRQSAGSVAALAELYFTEGKVVKASEHAPEYLRLSQAERERSEKEER